MNDTSDLYFAAALVACGHKLASTERREGKTHWVFDVKVDIESLEVQFINDALLVPARTFSDAIKRLKASTMRQ